MPALWQANNSSRTWPPCGVLSAITRLLLARRTEKTVQEDEIIGFDALYTSMGKCSKGVRRKAAVGRYCLFGMDEILKLHQELVTGTYRARPTSKVKITYPKPRVAVATSFRDRVYQRSLNDNAVYPAMSKGFIRHNAACQTGKGTDWARQQVKLMMEREYRQHGPDGWCLLVDIRHYYDTMPHEVANQRFERKLPYNVYARVRDVLDRQYTGEAGYSPGSQMVQLAGISVPDPIDHYIKERLRADKYVRFMDDSWICHHSKAQLEEWREAIRARYAAEGMELHPTKTKIVRLRDGFRFLGFIYRLTPEGKVIMTVDPQNVKAERKRLHRLAQLIKEGEKPVTALREQYKSWKAHAAKGNSKQLLQRMDKYVKSLLEGIT